MRILAPIVVVLMLGSSAMAADQLSNDVAECLVKSRAALGSGIAMGGRPPSENIDAYSARGKIYFNNPFVNQSPTFVFWKCLRLKGYELPDR